MELVQGTSVEQFDADRLWDLYHRSFPPRRRPGASQRPMSRVGFDAVLADPRFTKLVLIERGSADPLAGIAAITADPDVIPQGALHLAGAIWQDQLDGRRLWFVRFLVVDPAYDDTGAAAHLAGGIWTRAAGTGGVVLVDTTAFNDTAVRLPSALFHLARSIAPRTTLQQVDGAGLWAYEFPEPVLA